MRNVVSVVQFDQDFNTVQEAHCMCPHCEQRSGALLGLLRCRSFEAQQYQKPFAEGIEGVWMVGGKKPKSSWRCLVPGCAFLGAKGYAGVIDAVP